jgi:hypothetical protein
MKFFVHVYHVMRSKYDVEADDQIFAIESADLAYCNGDTPYECESAAEITGYIVDEVDDEAFENTRSYMADGRTLEGLEHFYVRYEAGDGNNMDLLVRAYSITDAFKVWQEYYDGWGIEEMTFADVIIDPMFVPSGRGAMNWDGSRGGAQDKSILAMLEASSAHE